MVRGAFQEAARRIAWAGLACAAYGTLVETRNFVVRRVRAPVLPDGAPQLRILHLSDIHLAPGNRAQLAFLETLAGLEPDLVINTGDNVASAAAIRPLSRALGRLLDRPGAYVFGSHDFELPQLTNPFGYLLRPAAGCDDLPSSADSSGDVDCAVSGCGGVEMANPTGVWPSGAEPGRVSTETRYVDPEYVGIPTNKLDDVLSSGSWVNVTDRRVVFNVMGISVEVRGVGDAHSRHDDYSLVAGPPAKGVDVSFGVTHAPYKRVLDAMTRDDVDLMLAGHTHGGQVCLPGFGALVTNCDLPRAKVKGLSGYRTKRHSSYLHVSAGLGQSPYAPFRFACPPEVTVLTLTSRSNG